MRTAALILAGGKSSRFGTDKSMLTIHGERMIETQVAKCRSLCDEVLILCGEKEKFHLDGVREVPDICPGQGPLGGIMAGMLDSRAELFFVLACDMPMFSVELAQKLLEKCGDGHDACIPRDGERLEPLCAVYRKSALPHIQQMLSQGEHRVRALFPQIRTAYLEREEWPQNGEGASLTAQEDMFYNINYPDDYDRWLERMV